MSAADNDAAKLLAKVIDRMDRVLFEHDLEFCDDKDWEQFAERVRELVYEFYDDNGDDKRDSDYDPDASSSSESESVSLEEGATEEQQSRKRKRDEK